MALVEDMESAARRAAELCKQMLDYSGKGRLVIAAYDLNEIVDETARLLEVSIPRDVELVYRLRHGLPAVEVDATQIRQVIMNLITNAAEAIGPRRGRVVLETALHAPTGGKALVLFRIQDDGRGMDEETMHRLFEPFFTTKFAGRGLGLAAVQGIVRGHGGTIEVQSKLHQGTTIEVRLPASNKPASALPQDHELDASWCGSGTALVVDDEERVRAYCRRSLEHAGFEVLTAADGVEALRVLREHGREHEIRVVFLDLTMPRMGGVEAYAEIHRMRPDLPVILATGFDSEDAAQRFSGERPAGFLQKPFTPVQLIAAARAVLEPESQGSFAGAWR
jgi:CheY-like chemotaxis protein